MKKLIKNKYIAILLVIGYGASLFYAGMQYCDYLVDSKTETVVKEKTLWKERGVTKILERPDGSKETTIVEKREKKSKSDAKRVVKINKRMWNVGLSQSLSLKTPVYSLGVQRRVFKDIFIGAYARTDKEFGVSLRFDF
jgi:hypothetical protein